MRVTRASLLALIICQAPLLASLPDGYFLVCGSAAFVVPFSGPKFTDPGSTKELKPVAEFIAKNHQGARAIKPADLMTRSKDGIFASSPFSMVDVHRGERVTDLCVIFGVGGVAYNIHLHKTITDPLSVSSPDAKRAFDAALKTSDDKCLEEAALLVEETTSP